MPESSMPDQTHTPLSSSLADLPERLAERHPGRAAFAVRSPGGTWSEMTSAAFASEVTALAKGFLAAGIEPGHAVAILARTRMEWTLSDFALWSVGAVPVPIYETSSADQVRWILEDSGAVAIVVESDRHADTVEQIRSGLPALAHVYVMDRGDLDRLALDGAAVDDADIDARRRGVDRNSLATIIYTSGTTGRPKGVELTHGNFLGLAESAITAIPDVFATTGTATLLFLPLAHVFARFVEVLAVAGGVRLGHTADLKNLMADLAGFQPTFVLAVPRVFEKIYNSAEARAEAAGRGKIFAGAAAAAIAYSEALDDGTVPLGLRMRHAVFDRLVYARLREAMGGQVAYAVSGGAPLGTRLGHFFRGIGLTILEGYGLTETSAPATVNRPGAIRIGTVGRPLPGVEIRLADDDEVLIKGLNVFRGYHHNAQATAEAFDDGWFRTGDLGRLDDDGFLSITGRKKEILVTAGGKNVAPAVLEDRLRAHPLISQAMVVGDGKPFIAALLTLDEEMYPGWAATHGMETVPVTAARSDQRIIDELQQAVDGANLAVSRAESIRKFVILDTDFTEDSGHLTPSLKLKRNVVMRDYAEDVDALYGD